MNSPGEVPALESRIQEFRDRDLPAEEARARARLASIHLSRNQVREAHSQYQTAFELFSSCGLAREAVRAANHLAVCLLRSGRPRAALEILQPLADGLKAGEDPGLTAAVTGNLGLVYTRLEDYTKGVECHKKVLELGQAIGRPGLCLQAQINLADSYLQENRCRQALGFALVARDAARELGARKELAAVYDLLGMISARQGDHRQAVRYHRRAYELADDLGDLHQQARSLANQGLSREALTELETAQDLISRARDLFQSLNSLQVEKTTRDLRRIQRSLDPEPEDRV